MNLRGAQELHRGSLRRDRRAFDHSGPLLSRGTPDVATEDRRVACAAGDRRVRVYTPAAATGKAAPGLVFFHGGGFTLGSIESHDGVCRALASEAGVVVASVDYRLAPEDPFPAAVDDAIAATRAILGDAAAYGMNARAVAVGGDSAGGNLAAVTARALRGSATVPALQLLIYPATDFTRAMPSHRYFGEGLVLTTPTMDWFLGCYGAPVDDPRASLPLREGPVGPAPRLHRYGGLRSPARRRKGLRRPHARRWREGRVRVLRGLGARVRQHGGLAARAHAGALARRRPPAPGPELVVRMPRIVEGGEVGEGTADAGQHVVELGHLEEAVGIEVVPTLAPERRVDRQLRRAQDVEPDRPLAGSGRVRRRSA